MSTAPWDVLTIPSRGRHETIVARTITSLKAAGCSIEKVEVWVAEEEGDAYRAAVRDEAGITVRTYTLADTGEQTLCVRGVRNLIARSYPVGTKLVSTDDDIKGYLTIDRNKKLVPANLPMTIRTLRRVATLYDDTLFGLYPISNGFFMKRVITTDLRLIVGGFYGFTVKDPPAQTVIDEKEDYERTIRFYLQHGGVIRCGYVCIDADYYAKHGGMQTYRTEVSRSEGAHRLHALFPTLTSEPVFEETSSQYELKLLPQRKGKTYDTAGNEVAK